ncbi:hypothetical protein COOONC_28449 [Cooperia oncophora]
MTCKKNLKEIPEVQEALSDEFDGIECSIGPGPDLSQSPFRLDLPHLGRQITFVPDVALLDGFSPEGLHRINLSKKSALFTDGQPSCCLELILGKGRNWRDPLTKLFNRLYPNKWAFFIAELEQVVLNSCTVTKLSAHIENNERTLLSYASSFCF